MKSIHSTWRKVRRLALVRHAQSRTRLHPSSRARGDSPVHGIAPAEELPPYEWNASLDHTSEPAFVHDAERRILRCNAAYAAKAGLPMDEILGRPYWQVLPKLSEAPPPCTIDPQDGPDVPIIASEDGRVFEEHRAAAPCPAGNFWYCRHLLEDITARKHLERALAREKAVVEGIIETAPSTFFLVDQEFKLVRWNNYVRQRTGLSDEQLLGRSVLSFIHEDDRPLASAKLLTALAAGSTQMEVRIVREPGDLSYFLTNARRIVIDDVPYVAGFCIDITDRKQAETKLEEQKRFLDALVENVPGVFCVLDREGNCLRWNSNVNKITGLGDQELYKRSSLLTIAEEDRPEAARRLQETFERGYTKAVLRMVTKDRGARAFLMTGRRFDVGDTPYVVGMGIDTTEQLATIGALEHEARTDGLTQIANRKHFIDRAVDEFARCRRYGHRLSLWILDLDHFKCVNDNFGHQAGDAVLRAFVNTSQQVLRDWDFIGRMGGEEFGVLLPETDGEQAVLVAERLRQTVAATVVPLGSDRQVSVTVSIGVATMREDDRDVHALLARADGALYQAKSTGRDKVAVAAS